MDIEVKNESNNNNVSIENKILKSKKQKYEWPKAYGILSTCSYFIVLIVFVVLSLLINHDKIEYKDAWSIITITFYIAIGFNATIGLIFRPRHLDK